MDHVKLAAKFKRKWNSCEKDLVQLMDAGAERDFYIEMMGEYEIPDTDVEDIMKQLGY